VEDCAMLVQYLKAKTNYAMLIQ